jgi:hypothetical protein
MAKSRIDIGQSDAVIDIMAKLAADNALGTNSPQLFQL